MTVLAATVGTVTLPASDTAEAQIAQCVITPEGHCSVYVDVRIPNRPGGPGRPGGGDYEEPPWPCGHETPWTSNVDQSQLLVHFPYAPVGSVLQWRHCVIDVDNTPIDRQDWRYIPPGGVPLNRRPTPEEVAWWLRFGVDAFIDGPELAADPALGTPTVLTIPTFISVTNWQGRIMLQDCRWGTCVTLTADAELVFRPGERGARGVECNDAPRGPGTAGTRFDPNNPASPRDQAGSGVCAYAYTQRTGVDGRPERWHGQVVETWAVSWIAGAASGTFDDIVFSTPLDREVIEFQAVVTDAEIGPPNGD